MVLRYSHTQIARQKSTQSFYYTFLLFYTVINHYEYKLMYFIIVA